jgi:hypothetical protein
LDISGESICFWTQCFLRNRIGIWIECLFDVCEGMPVIGRANLLFAKDSYAIQHEPRREWRASVRPQATRETSQPRPGRWIDSPFDLPEGFFYPDQAPQWRKAIFLPGERNGSSPANDVARICILTPDRLVICAHAASREEPFVAPLEQLVAIISHKVSLRGTVEFYTLHGAHRFYYASVHQKIMNGLLSAIRSAWLSLQEEQAFPARTILSKPALEERCRNALKLELNPGETVFGFCSQISRKRRFYRQGGSESSPLADSCLVFTNRRIVTVASGRNGVRIAYAPNSSATKAEIRQSVDGFELCLTLRNQHVWKMGLGEDGASAILGAFAACIGLRCG